MRKDLSRAGTRGSRAAPLLITIGATVAAAALLLLLVSESFPEALRLFFVAPLANRYYLGNTIAAMAPLIVAGLGIAISFESRSFNLGGEGQIYAGAFVATIVAVGMVNAPAPLAVAASCGAAILAGGLIGAVSGILKRALKVDELISSFLISSAVSFIVDYLVTGPFQDPASNFQTTLAIGESLRFPKIFPPSGLSAGIFAALALALAGKIALDRTRFGFELRICGANSEFARYAGIDTEMYTALPMAISGALHGLAGFLMVFGSYYKTMKGFSAGAGWSAIAVALIAGRDPLALIPSALFYAWLETGSRSLMLGSGAGGEIVSIVQAVIFMLVTARILPRALRSATGKGGRK